MAKNIANNITNITAFEVELMILALVLMVLAPMWTVLDLVLTILALVCEFEHHPGVIYEVFWAV